MIVSPTTFLENRLVPVSQEIDKFGGPNIIVGIIASGGQPHMAIIGNVKGEIRAELYEALADRLRQAADEVRKGMSSIVKAPTLTVV